MLPEPPEQPTGEPLTGGMSLINYLAVAEARRAVGSDPFPLPRWIDGDWAATNEVGARMVRRAMAQAYSTAVKLGMIFD